jgi:hypothetical protein
MKNLLKFIPFIVFAIVLKACTAENSVLLNNETDQFSQSNPPCVDDDPITRVVNNGTITFQLQVMNEDGVEVVNFVSVPPNTTTSWASFDSGLHIFYLKDVSDSSNSSMDKAQLQMDNCMALEIEIDANDQVVSFVPTTL